MLYLLKKSSGLLMLLSVLPLVTACSTIPAEKSTATRTINSSPDNGVLNRPRQNEVAKYSIKTTVSANSRDPWERFNRYVYASNKKLDAVLLKPVSKVYKAITPDLVDKGVTNFFSNLEDVGNAINNLLQCKPESAINDSARFMFNSTIGLAGFLDVASEMNMVKHDEDFGQTLAKWGVKSGPYLMFPVLGPTTLRDVTARLSIDRFTDPVSYSDESIALSVVKVVDKRADFLSREEMLMDLGADEYSTIRDAWLQRRNYQIRDGRVDKQKQTDMIDQLESLDGQ